MAKGQLKKQPIFIFEFMKKGKMAPNVVTLLQVMKSWNFSLAFFLYLVIRQFIIYSTEYCSLVDVLVLLTL